MALEPSSLALSVVIIGRNEGSRLMRCIRSTRAIRGIKGAIEIIYVDSDSSDGSAARARDMGVAVVSLQSSRRSAAIGRNAGWRVARAPVVMFLDGDTILDPDFVASAIPLLRDPNVAVVWGHRRELHPEASIYHRVLDLDWISQPGPAEACGGDALMRRAALEHANGFDERLVVGEEAELCRRLRGFGYRIEHIDQPMTLHDLDISSWHQYWRRAVQTGYALAETSERFRSEMPEAWRTAARRNRLHAGGLVLSALLALVSSVLLASVWPILLLLATYLALVVHAAGKAAWKESNPLTRFLYGLHCHLQQIPVLVGQTRYYRDRFAGR
jgi:cellulose synthase/poly-beta-1,6-N-acetylglucosamine synthase-like glycosyltransferase